MPIEWQAANYRDLLQETWDEETFIFNPASGHTHVLNAVAADILAMLAKQPTSIDSLLTSFTEGDTGPEQQQLRAALTQQLSQLQAMGLIKTTS